MRKQKSVSVAVKGEGGMVILKFDHDVDYLEMEPENALLISEAMATAAFECKEGFKPVGAALKAELVQKHREKLVPRIALMMNSLREKKTVSNGQLALQLVDTCMSEIFS
jgi:hypothetical protein